MTTYRDSLPSISAGLSWIGGGSPSSPAALGGPMPWTGDHPWGVPFEGLAPVVGPVARKQGAVVQFEWLGPPYIRYLCGGG